MNIFIVGAGEIGRYLATSLSEKAHDITVFELDEVTASELDGRVDARVVAGDGSSASLLIENGVAECELFFALTSKNNTNLVASSVAKSLGAAKVICRVHPGLQRDEWLFDYRREFGVDHLFSSERLAAVELSKSIRHPDSVAVEEIARGQIEIQQLEIGPDSAAAGVSLADLQLGDRVRIGMIRRGSERIVPGASDTVQSGDTVVLFGRPRGLADAMSKLGVNRADDAPPNVVVFGGGEYGFCLAQLLDGLGCKTRVFDRDPAVCEGLSHTLESATVINADATSLDELREEQVGDADFFVATTQSDEDNVMTCLQAHNLGTASCLTLIHRADYADAISSSGSKFGIKAAVSPREVARAELLRFITADRFHVVKRLEGAEVIEAAVRASSALASRKVSEVDWPEGTLVMAITRGIRASVPAPDDVIGEGDHLYFLVQDSSRRRLVRLL